MRLATSITLLLIFLGGAIAGFLIANTQSANAQPNTEWKDTPTSELMAYNPFQNVQARENPRDRVPEKAIAVYKDHVVLDVANVQWATFTDTHSMEPVIFKGANALEVTPTSEDDIKVGDIVSYKSEYATGNIIHRVVYKGKDEQGTYFIMKGDNLPASDPGRVRFSQMQRVVVGIVY